MPNVVIAEDDPVIQLSLEQELLKLGLNVVYSFDMKEDLVQSDISTGVNLLLTNLRLLDGWIDDRYLAYISEHFEKVIVVTGLNDLKGESLLKDKSEYSYLFKPFSIYQLQNHIREVLS